MTWHTQLWMMLERRGFASLIAYCVLMLSYLEHTLIFSLIRIILCSSCKRSNLLINNYFLIFKRLVEATLDLGLIFVVVLILNSHIVCLCNKIWTIFSYYNAAILINCSFVQLENLFRRKRFFFILNVWYLILHNKSSKWYCLREKISTCLRIRLSFLLSFKWRFIMYWSLLLMRWTWLGQRWLAFNENFFDFFNFKVLLRRLSYFSSRIISFIFTFFSL